MQFLDINGVRRFKQYTDDTFITSEEVSEVEEATLENFYTKTEIDNIVSDLEDEIQSGGGSGGGTITETDPTVPAWAKQSTKPTYTAAEVGAQETLVSGTNIKTINNESLLGSGNITINEGETNVIESVTFNGTPANITNKIAAITATIPTTLDQITDGTNRKLADYYPKSGGSLNPNSELSIATDNPDDARILLNGNGLYLWNNGGGNTHYGESKISIGSGLGDNFEESNYYSWPINKSGTIALTSDIPAAVTESTVSGWGFTKNSGTYSKPSGGIPATDLASAVQTSLGKADTALQSYTETDPTVPSWAKAASKPTYTASEVGALPNTTVIPTVNNGTLTIQKNGTNVQTFTANQSNNVTANIQVNEVPSYSSSNNGQILMVVNGALAWINPTVIYSGNSVPSNDIGNNGDIYLQS